MTDWYTAQAGTPRGPMSESALRALIQLKQVGPTTLLWQPGFVDWTPAEQVTGLLGPPPADFTAPPGAAHASLALRFWARMFDLLLWQGILIAALAAIFPSIFHNRLLDSQLGTLILPPLLFPFALILDALSATVFGNTPGKAIAGITLLDAHGRRLSLHRQLRRNFTLYGWGLGAKLPLLYLLMLAFSAQRARAGHVLRWDVVASTRAWTLKPSTRRLGLIALLYLALLGASLFAGKP